MAQIPEFVRKAIEAQGKVSPEEIEEALDRGDPLAEEKVPAVPEPEQEALPLEPVCPRCGGSRQVWSYESDQWKPCPECSA